MVIRAYTCMALYINRIKHTCTSKSVKVITLAVATDTVIR